MITCHQKNRHALHHYHLDYLDPKYHYQNLNFALILHLLIQNYQIN